VSKSRTTQILYTRRCDVTTDSELNALASIYRFLLLEKGDRHDLTSEAATQAEGANQGKKGHDGDVCC
jgi:hypothetical protein